jgi:hypothetical protein
MAYMYFLFLQNYLLVLSGELRPYGISTLEVATFRATTSSTISANYETALPFFTNVHGFQS